MNFDLVIIFFSILEGSCVNAQFSQYGGNSFPVKYLSPENSTVTSADIDYYINSLQLPLRYFNESPNWTDINTALCAFYTKSLLKRTIKDYGIKLQKIQTDGLKTIISMCDNLISHYVYTNGMYGWNDLGFRVSRLLISDESQVHSIGKFNRGRLRQWILTEDDNVNSYLQAMDEAILPKEKYSHLNSDHTGEEFYMDMSSSDECASRISYNGDPVDATQLRRCKIDPYCENQIYSDPSIGYYLTHRFLNAYIRHSKRCYLRSEGEDAELMERLCAHGYREAVYLARAGFFMRDLFLEHLALCSMLGYEEFHRRSWFRKAASWVDGRGCVAEHVNYVRNRSLLMKRVGGVRARRRYLAYICELSSACLEHAMALVTTVLAHGIRHAAHFM